MRVALLSEALSAPGKYATLLPRSMGEIDELLSRIRPAASGIDASYGSTVSLGETGSEPSKPHSTLHMSPLPPGSPLDVSAANGRFVRFSPDQGDLDGAIDDIWSSSDRGESQGSSFGFPGLPPVAPERDGLEFSGNAVLMISMALAAAFLLAIFMIVS
jgi:hypothetical protein